MAPDLARAMNLAAELEAIIPTIPHRHVDRPGHERGIDALERAVMNADARGALAQDWKGGLIRACGLRSTSTSGAIGACQNFIRQIELLAAASGAGTKGRSA